MAAAQAFNGQMQGAPTDTSVGRAPNTERVIPPPTATLGTLQSHVLQSEAQGDDIGGRKWSRLQTLAFIVLASGALWVAIGLAVYRVLTR